MEKREQSLRYLRREALFERRRTTESSSVAREGENGGTKTCSGWRKGCCSGTTGGDAGEGAEDGGEGDGEGEEEGQGEMQRGAGLARRVGRAAAARLKHAEFATEGAAAAGGQGIEQPTPVVPLAEGPGQDQGVVRNQCLRSFSTLPWTNPVTLQSINPKV